MAVAATVQATGQAIGNLKRDISSWMTSIGAGHVSKSFFEFIKAIGEAKSKQVRLSFQCPDCNNVANFVSPSRGRTRSNSALGGSIYHRRPSSEFEESPESL